MNWIAPLLLGAGLAVSTIFLALRMPRQRAFQALAVILGYTASLYVGAALAQPRTDLLLEEIAVSAVVGGLAVYGLWRNPKLLMLGFLVHGTWDFFHHVRHLGAPAGTVLPLMCILYDAMMALLILLL